MDSDAGRIAQILKDAMSAVKDADVPPELQATALEKAIDLLAGGPPESARAGIQRDRAGALASDRKGDESVLGKIADELKLERDVIAEVFHFNDDDGLRIVLGTGKFESAKRAGTKQLALLLAAGRQAAGMEEWTATKDLIIVVKDFNRFDSANFAYTIKQMDDVFLFSGGSAHERKVKVNRHGKEAAAALIRMLTGGDRA